MSPEPQPQAPLPLAPRTPARSDTARSDTERSDTARSDTARSDTARRSVVVIVIGLLAAVFVSSPLHLPLNNPNEGVRVFAVKALVEQHRFAIDDVVKQWGFIDDKALCGPAAPAPRQRCSSKAPLVSLIAAAAYAVVHPVTGDLARPALTRLCRLTGGVLPASLALGVLWWALRRRAREASGPDRRGDVVVVDVVVCGAVVGSGVLASLNVFSGHALAALAPGAVLALALLHEVPSTARLAFAGALLSAAACAEYPAALATPLALLLVLRCRPEDRVHAVVVVVVAGFVAALPTMFAHHAMFGAPWRTGYSSLDNPSYQPLVAGTFFGVGAPDLQVLGTALFSPELGLFFYSPLLLAGVVGVWRLPPRARVVVGSVVVAFCLFIAGFRGWRGGWSVGPRYISELIGILSVTAVVGLQTLPTTTARLLAFAGAGVGVVCSGLAGAFFPHLPDLLRNPVVELVLPTVARGFAPDSVPLALGCSSAVAGVVVVVCVAAPLLLTAAVHRASAAVGLLAVVPFVVVATMWPGTEPRARGREVRRMADNWRPERGVPWLDPSVGGRDGVDDPRLLFAIDRGRAVQGRSIDCAFSAPLPRRFDVGAGHRVVADVVDGTPPGSLIIVDDALADHVAPAGGASLVITFSDLERFVPASRPLPCSGDVVVVTRPAAPGTRPHPRLAGMRASAPRPNAGFVVTTFAR